LKRRIAEVDERVKFAVHHFLSHRQSFDTKIIRKFIYEDMENQARVLSTEFETDPEIIDPFQQHLPDEYKDDKVPKEVVNKFKSLPTEAFFNDETGEPVDFGDIVNSLEVEYIEAKRVKELNSLSFEERYKRGLFDKTNIFEVFGFCHSINPNTGKPFVPESYKSLLLRLADYRFNRNPKEKIENFNSEWVDNFLIFLKEEGYATNRIKQATPFTFGKYAADLIISERNPYIYQSYKKQIKHLKFYIDILQKEKLIPRISIDTRDISIKNYINKDEPIYTRCSHALLLSEIHDLMEARLAGKLESARIMFLIQTLAGGLRNDEFLNKHFKLKMTNGLYYFSYYANKVSDYQENPLIIGYTDVVLEQVNYKLPEFLKVEEYRQLLKCVAKEVGLDREIRYKIALANGKIEIIDTPIYESIKPYWCRKSFVKLGRTLGWTNEIIAAFTGHADPSIIDKHYFDKLSLDDKAALVNK
jgi:hypothetical protein